MIKFEKPVVRGINLCEVVKGEAYEIVTIPHVWTKQGISVGDWCVAIGGFSVVTLKGETIHNNHNEFTLKQVNLVVRLAE